MSKKILPVQLDVAISLALPLTFIYLFYGLMVEFVERYPLEVASMAVGSLATGAILGILGYVVSSFFIRSSWRAYKQRSVSQ